MLKTKNKNEQERHAWWHRLLRGSKNKHCFWNNYRIYPTIPLSTLPLDDCFKCFWVCAVNCTWSYLHIMFKISTHMVGKYCFRPLNYRSKLFSSSTNDQFLLINHRGLSWYVWAKATVWIHVKHTFWCRSEENQVLSLVSRQILWPVWTMDPNISSKSLNTSVYFF